MGPEAVVIVRGWRSDGKEEPAANPEGFRGCSNR
jgi:hypothetical protein